MTDDATTTSDPAALTPDEATAALRCPWCSELLTPDATVQCPHCHANLVAGPDTRLPGVTEVEAPSATKLRRAEPAKRSKLLSWISGDLDDEPAPPIGGPSAPDAVALPPRDVRREMLRLQLEAEGLTVAADGSIEYPSTVTHASAGGAPTDPAKDQVSVGPTAAGEAPQKIAGDAEPIRKAS